MKALSSLLEERQEQITLVLECFLLSFRASLLSLSASICGFTFHLLGSANATFHQSRSLQYQVVFFAFEAEILNYLPQSSKFCIALVMLRKKQLRPHALMILINFCLFF